MSFLRKLGGSLQKIGGAVSAVPGLGLIGSIGSIGGSLLQGRAPNIGQVAGIIPGVGTIGAIAGVAGSLGGRGSTQRGSTNMNIMPQAPAFQPPAFNFGQPGTGQGGSGSMGGLPAIIPSATALQRFLAWAGAIALGQATADTIADLVRQGVPWSNWAQGARNIWNQFAESQSMTNALGLNGMNGDNCFMPIVVDAVYEMRATAPKGYVIVEHNGIKVAMEKGRARQCGKWKPAKKPPITASEYRQLQTAGRVEKKIKTLATKSGQICRPRKR